MYNDAPPLILIFSFNSYFKATLCIFRTKFVFLYHPTHNLGSNPAPATNYFKALLAGNALSKRLRNQFWGLFCILPSMWRDTCYSVIITPLRAPSRVESNAGVSRLNEFAKYLMACRAKFRKAPFGAFLSVENGP